MMNTKALNMRRRCIPLSIQRGCLLLMIILSSMVAHAYNSTYNVKVGDTFTVYTTYKSYTQSIIWDYDWSAVEPVNRIYETTNSVTFRALKATSTSVIQATTYYYRNGTSSSGINKSVDNWKVVIEEDSKPSNNATVRFSDSYMNMSVGDAASLYVYIDGTYTGNYNWSSSNPSVATVMPWSIGTVTIKAEGPGTTYVTLRLDNGNYATCEVYVSSPTPTTPTSVSIPSSYNLNFKQTAKLNCVIQPSNVNATLTWKSSNPSVVSVDSNGNITSLWYGKATITVNTQNGKSASCLVTVPKPNFYFIVQTKNDEQFAYPLAEHPHVEQQGDELILSTDAGTVYYNKEAVSKFYIATNEENLPNAIKQMIQTENPSFHNVGGKILLEGVPANSAVNVYDASGVLVSTTQASTQGTATIDLCQFKNGVYIIKSAHTSFKILHK